MVRRGIPDPQRDAKQAWWMETSARSRHKGPGPTICFGQPQKQASGLAPTQSQITSVDNRSGTQATALATRGGKRGKKAGLEMQQGGIPRITRLKFDWGSTT